MNEREALKQIVKGRALVDIVRDENLAMHIDIGQGVIVKASTKLTDDGKIELSGSATDESGAAQVTITVPPAMAEKYLRKAVDLNLGEKLLAWVQNRGGSRRVVFADRRFRPAPALSKPKVVGVGASDSVPPPKWTKPEVD